MAEFPTIFYGCGINHSRCKEDCYWYREEQDMCAHIPYCQSKGGNYIEPEDCENCEHYHSKYEKTNADHIRSMSDEELAKWICDILGDDCFEEWIDWLRQKEKEGE